MSKKISTDCCEVVVQQADASRGGGCCDSLPRRFITSKEKLEGLKKYKEELKNELTGVDERLKELDGK